MIILSSYPSSIIDFCCSDILVLHWFGGHFDNTCTRILFDYYRLRGFYGGWCYGQCDNGCCR